MSKVRYLGSKARLVEEIRAAIGEPIPNQRFVDLFCGTGIVSHVMGNNGWPVITNDFLQAASIVTTASLLTSQEVPFKKLGGYEKTILLLNGLKGKKGFFYREYSPSKNNRECLSSPYFSEENAKKIDAIRGKIKLWYLEKKISSLEKKLLLADLIGAANQVANIAGTYGCFLKQLSKQALKPLFLENREFNEKPLDWESHNKDAFEIKANANDVVYLDPPYTKRQYAAYYHIPETIACEDEPTVEGVTGLRPWMTKSSPFCYKAHASAAMQKLISGIDSNRILISYSSDGHISYKKLISIAKEFGTVSVKKINNFSRYSPNVTATKRPKKALTEYLINIDR